MDSKPCIWSYVVVHDKGSAPCVDDNLLSLCICKPLIRRSAKVGDWLIGFARKKVGSNLIIYIAEITKKISMKEYFMDQNPRLDKIYNVVGDKLVHYGGEIHNNPKNWKTDLSGEYCLISENYKYFGNSPISNIEELYDLYHPYVGQKKTKKEKYIYDLKKFFN